MQSLKALHHNLASTLEPSAVNKGIAWGQPEVNLQPGINLHHPAMDTWVTRAMMDLFSAARSLAPYT
jgi:hypothetical protein